MELVNITYAGTGQSYQNYSEKDETLISYDYIYPQFGGPDDYVEMFIFSEDNNIISQNYSYSSYTPINVDSSTDYFSAIEIDPYQDTKSAGVDRGSFSVQYNFLRNLFNSSTNNKYWIKDISPSRTELRLSSQDLSNDDILAGFNFYQAASDLKNYKNDFYLNFGANRLILGINAAYEIYESGESFLLVKLYEPLEEQFSIKDELWIVEKAAESIAYKVKIEIPFEESEDIQFLRGPNFSISSIDQVSQTTNFYNYNNLFSSNISSSIQQLKSWMDDKSIRINVDYSDFSNFVHFSSAKERISNFVYKLQLIEDYTAQISDLYSYQVSENYTGSISSSVNLIKNKVDKIIEKFDLYEYFLYFDSSSHSWPKRTSTKPYSLYSTTSSNAIDWLGSESVVSAGKIYSASVYDIENKNRLSNNIPGYLSDDESNQPFVLFMDMVGQHFDNLWIYYKDLSNRYVNDNNPNTGISLDLVGDALKSFGLELYTNTNISENVYYNLFGINEDGSILPPTGSEMISEYVTSSISSIPANDTHKEIYKRLYHNLPYLLKTKGTQRGIKALISCYGIPSDILYVKEFGGQNRYGSNDILDVNNDKITYSTSSFDINSTTLSPFATLQYFDNDKHPNSLDIEVGFSPTDLLNAHITSSLPSLFIENIVMNPGYAASSSYAELDYIKRQYFSQYHVKRFNIWDYIRLLKYYNNSIFKLIRDFVPARANLHTGLIIKSHILERNKYSKKEIDSDFENNMSQSIEILDISGGHPGHLEFSTNNVISKQTLSGSVTYNSTDGREKFTGELGGSIFKPKPLISFNQSETSSILNPHPSYSLVTYSPVSNFNNVTESRRSKRFFDLDYSYRQTVPVNFNIISEITDDFSSGSSNYNLVVNDRNTPMSFVQDYNYYTNAFTVPRYFGSKTISDKYLYYSEGDISYGKTAAIDKIKYQYAYLVDIYTASFNLNKRSNAQIKYIIDNDQNILDLTKANTNIFYTQNIFKSGETINISLFDYDPINPDVQFLTNNSNLRIYEGGWRYSPILYKLISGCLYYKIDPPIIETQTVESPPITTEISAPGYVANDFFVRIQNIFNPPTSVSPNDWVASIIRVEMTYPLTPTPTENIYVYVKLPYSDGTFTYRVVTIAAGQRSGQSTINNPRNGTFPWTETLSSIDKFVVRREEPGGTYTITRRIDNIVDCEANLYVINSNEVMLSKLQSDYYGRFIMSQSHTVPGMEIPVFSFSLATGDMFKFYHPNSGWIEDEEYRVVSVSDGVDDDGNQRKIVKLNKEINAAVIENNQIPGNISLFIINKHIPDETNVILRYDPKSSITQDGIVYPEYISPQEKDSSGNVIKSLKSQNLI